MKQNSILFLASILMLFFFAGCNDIGIAIAPDTSSYNTTIDELNSTHTQITKSNSTSGVESYTCIISLNSTTYILQEAC